MKKNELIAVFIFYNYATGKQARLAFSDELKHCNIITYDGQDWIMLDFDQSGLLTRKIYCKDGQQLLRALPKIHTVSAIISVMVKERKKTGWRPWWVRSCNEVCRYASGVDIGFTFNPRHLFSKLLRYDGKWNYEILSAWRRSDGFIRQR